MCNKTGDDDDDEDLPENAKNPKPAKSSKRLFNNLELDRKAFEKVENKLISELDISVLLHKIRTIYAMMSHLMTKEQKRLCKFNGERVIEVRSETSSSESSGSSSCSDDGQNASDSRDEDGIGESIPKSINNNID